MVHKTTKKLLGKGKKKVKKKVKKFAETVVDRAQRSDLLPDIPGPDPIINAVATIAALHPGVRLPLMAYMMAENTERYWGPKVYGAADDYMDWYERNVRSRYAGSEIDPGSPLGYYPAPQMPMQPPTPEVKAKRKVTKANKATKAAYQWLLKQENGKMTAAKCRKLLAQAAKMASKANPATKSRIGKRITKKLKECGKIRRDVWKTNKRY